VSRFARALAAASMAVAAAGSGLLIAAAGAVPASAATHVTHRGHPRGHTTTITAHHRAQAAGGIGPHDILPCTAKPGVTPASCGEETISCLISAPAPDVDTAARLVEASAIVQCSGQVTAISLHEALLRTGIPVSTDNDPEQNSPSALTLVTDTCRMGTFANDAWASITFPPGYTVVAGPAGPIHDTSGPRQVLPFGCTPGGSGGGCAIAVPSLAGHPAGRHPDVISCP